MIQLIEKSKTIFFENLEVGKIYAIEGDVFTPVLCCLDFNNNDKFLVYLRNGYVMADPGDKTYNLLKVQNDMTVSFD